MPSANSLQGRRTRTGSRATEGSGKSKSSAHPAEAAAAPGQGTGKGKKQPFSWIYGDDEEIAAAAEALVLPSERRTRDASAQERHNT